MPVKKKKHVNRTVKANERELLFRDESQMYGIAVAPLGDRRFSVVIDEPDNVRFKVVVGRLRGSMRRSERVLPGTCLLCSHRDDGANKVDILHRYIETHEKLLRRYKEFDDLDRKYRQWQVENMPGYAQGADDVSDPLTQEIVFEDADMEVDEI
jgi:translation initiation factor IF-1